MTKLNHGHRIIGTAYGRDTVDEMYCELCCEWLPTYGFTEHLRCSHPHGDELLHYRHMAAEAGGAA